MRLIDRLRSAHYGVWLRVSQRLGPARGPRSEQPAGSLAGADLAAATRARIEHLARRYDVRFEARYGVATAL